VFIYLLDSEGFLNLMPQWVALLQPPFCVMWTEFPQAR
jgi:hypothetical protein